MQCEHLEDELREAWARVDELKQNKPQQALKKDSSLSDASKQTNKLKEKTSTPPNSYRAHSKELEEAQFAIDKLNTEIGQNKMDISRLKNEIKEEASRADTVAKENDELLEEVLKLRDFKEDMLQREKESLQKRTFFQNLKLFFYKKN